MERTRRASTGRSSGFSKQRHRSAQGPVPTRIRRAATLRSGRVLGDTENSKRPLESHSERGSQNASTSPTKHAGRPKQRTPRTHVKPTSPRRTRLRSDDKPDDDNPDDVQRQTVNVQQTVADTQPGTPEALVIANETLTPSPQVDAILNRIYYDVRHKAGFASIRKLYDAVKQKEGFTYKVVKA